MTDLHSPEVTNQDLLINFESKSQDIVRGVLRSLPSGTGLFTKVSRMAVELTQQVLEAQKSGIPEEQIVEAVSQASYQTH